MYCVQLASNFASFFERLVRLLEQLSDVVPQYGELAKLASAFESPRMRRQIEGVYIDILQLFQDVAQIFTSARGSMQ